MIRTFEQQPEVALQLSMIGGEDDVGVVGPAPRRDLAEDPSERFVDQFTLHRVTCVDLTNLVVGQRCRNPILRCFVVRYQRSVVPQPPMSGFRVEDRFAFAPVGRISGRQRNVTRVDAFQFGLRRIPRMMRVREAHPTKPVVVVRTGAEPVDCALGDPVGVVPVARDRIVVHLRRPRRAAAGRVDVE